MFTKHSRIADYSRRHTALRRSCQKKHGLQFLQMGSFGVWGNLATKLEDVRPVLMKPGRKMGK